MPPTSGSRILFTVTGLEASVSEKWPDEPDEANPESQWGDPERDIPTVPEVQTPGSNSSADPELVRLFWASVVAANVGLFGVSLGGMLIFFEGDWTYGGLSIAVGAFGFLRTYTYYQRVEARKETSDGDGD